MSDLNVLKLANRGEIACVCLAEAGCKLLLVSHLWQMIQGRRVASIASSEGLACRVWLVSSEDTKRHNPLLKSKPLLAGLISACCAKAACSFTNCVAGIIGGGKGDSGTSVKSACWDPSASRRTRMRSICCLSFTTSVASASFLGPTACNQPVSNSVSRGE